MANVRVMAIHQGGTGLPEDRIVNTFHFHHATRTYEDLESEASTAVFAFYSALGTAPNAQTVALESYYPAWIQSGWETRSYDLTVPPKQRVPVIRPRVIFSFGSQPALPEEVAVVATFYGSPPVTRRRRGRLYFGPLRNSASNNPVSNGVRTQVVPELIANLTKACQSLLINCPSWCVRSTLPSENFVPIIGGYVDDAFDIQRRRGPDPTARTVWNAGI